jgi:hypothetical protein
MAAEVWGRALSVRETGETGERRALWERLGHRDRRGRGGLFAQESSQVIYLGVVGMTGFLENMMDLAFAGSGISSCFKESPPLACWLCSVAGTGSSG